METAEVIFKFIIVSLNAYALMFTLILVINPISQK